jgi:hypothetical protein
MRSNSRDAMQGVTLGSFDPEPLAGIPARVTRRTSSPGRIPVVLTDQASARTIVQPGSASVDEEMVELARGTPSLEQPVITYPDRVNTAVQNISEPNHAVTADGVDGTAAGSSLGGIAPPRAHRPELIHLGVEGGAEPVTTDPRAADGHVTFGSPVSNSSDLTEIEQLRRTIAQGTLQLNALTTGDRRRRGPSSSGPSASMIDTLRAGASTSILRNGLRDTPPLRTVAQIPVPDYPHTYEKQLNVAGIFAMAKVNQKYSGPVSGEKSTKHKKRSVNFMVDVKNTVTQFKHSETLRLGHLSAISHLDGDAKELVGNGKH